MASTPSALILIAEGTEESEFTITYDVLVRAGVSVQSALVGSSSNEFVTCSRGIKIVPHLTLRDLEGGKALDYSALIIPGGAKGAETISSNPDVQKLISAMYGQGKLIGAICAGSLAAKTSGIGKDREITSHPSVKAELDKEYKYLDERVVKADNLVTSRGPGTAFEFALKLVEVLCGKDKAEEIEGPLMMPEKARTDSSPDQAKPPAQNS